MKIKSDLLLHAPNINFLDEEDKMNTAHLVINNTIGEANRIYYIKAIHFIEDHQHQENPLHAITKLKAAFEILVEQL